MIRVADKKAVIKLRKNGRSLNEIAARLNIAKSTVSLWCRNVQISSKYIQRLIRREELGSFKGRKKFLENITKARIKETAFLRKQGIKEIGKLDKRDFLIAGVAMYWSEGYTYSGGEQVGFTNSDPKMILFILKWFKEVCGISKDRFSFQVKANVTHKYRVKEIENYWADLIRFPMSQFNKTTLIKSKNKKVYQNFESYFGTFRITVHQGTKLRRKIHGLIEGLSRMQMDK